MIERNKYRKLTSPNTRQWHEHKPLSSRFLEKVEKGEGCWLWKSVCNESGYGMFWVNEHKTQIPAHRVSFMIFRGEIPEGMDVCHTCDNPKCVNPEHLFTGTNLDNILDARKKGRLKLRGRTLTGFDSRASKFRPDQVEFMRSQKRTFGLIGQLAKAFGVSRDTISKIYNGNRYV